MPDRYFITPPITADRATLRDDEAHHLAHVMRAKTGAEIIVFDGGGREWLARVARLRRNEVDLDLIERRDCDRELSADVTLAVALPKGDRQRWLVEKSVELGVRRIVPLTTDRGVAQPVEKALDRLRRAVIEASKQCGRNRLMEIAAPQRWPDFCAATAVPNELRLAADPLGGDDLGSLIETLRTAGRPWSLVFAVGPEGGWTDGERQCAAAHDWRIVSLGPRILRIETAALLLASVTASTAHPP
ncbi:MAG TPA: RsmE family RNA methyltransferase [Pirellulales bacterium]|nr:RsmE family RNA methyltransferase [Pirellulales bacterium]